jgi:hypothetical protein
VLSEWLFSNLFVKESLGILNQTDCKLNPPEIMTQTFGARTQEIVSPSPCPSLETTGVELLTITVPALLPQFPSLFKVWGVSDTWGWGTKE